jgi:hypothetical protein
VIDLGTQETSFQGKPKKSRQLMLSWELRDALMDEDRPFSISKRYTYSSSPKSNLRKDLESWRGKRFEDAELGTFDIGKLLGAPCMLNVVHVEKNGEVYANIAAIMRLPRGTAVPRPTNEMVVLSLDDRPFDRAAYEKLGERLRETIARSPEFKRAWEDRPLDDEPPPASESDYGADDIPF